MLTSVPETRNAISRCLKEEERLRGEVERSEEAYLKDLSCMVT